MGARAEHPFHRHLVSAVPHSAQPAIQGTSKTQCSGWQLPLKPRAVTLRSSFWACASQAVLDPLPHVCGLISFAAGHLVPPWRANVNKVTCTSTPCLSFSLQPALTLPKYDRYVLTRMPCSDVPAPVVTLLLAGAASRLPCNQH